MQRLYTRRNTAPPTGTVGHAGATVDRGNRGAGGGRRCVWTSDGVYVHMERYRGRYRTASARLPGWDYATPGWYFVTICTRHRQPVFGRVRNGTMHRSDLGDLAHGCWEAVPVHHPGTRLDAFVVMPDHVHGLLGLPDAPSAPHPPAAPRGARTTPMGRLSPRAGTLGLVLRSYKGAVTRRARRAGADFAWQARFYDHVVRNGRDLDRIRQYILQNPARWSARFG